MGLVLVLIFAVYIFVVSLRNILIGSGKFAHPMYDTEEKMKFALKRGIVGLVVSVICGGFFGLLVYWAFT